jgi:hypothetical protein
MESEKSEQEVKWHELFSEFIHHVYSNLEFPENTYRVLKAWDESASSDEKPPCKILLTPEYSTDFSIERSKEIIDPDLIIKVFDIYEGLTDKIGAFAHRMEIPNDYYDYLNHFNGFLVIFDELIESEYRRNRKQALNEKLRGIIRAELAVGNKTHTTLYKIVWRYIRNEEDVPPRNRTID